MVLSRFLKAIIAPEGRHKNRHASGGMSHASQQTKFLSAVSNVQP